MKPLDELARCALDTGAPEAERALLDALRGVSEPAMLRQLAADFYAEPEVPVPTFERLLELTPGDVVVRVELGFVYFLMGEDAQARQQLERARAVDPEHVQVLTLEAALTNDTAEKARLYRRILQKEPRNEVALGKLRELGAAP
jgi:thioredoxin-like negative regulator of GroEL